MQARGGGRGRAPEREAGEGVRGGHGSGGEAGRPRWSGAERRGGMGEAREGARAGRGQAAGEWTQSMFIDRDA